MSVHSVCEHVKCRVHRKYIFEKKYMRRKKKKAEVTPQDTIFLSLDITGSDLTA